MPNMMGHNDAQGKGSESARMPDAAGAGDPGVVSYVMSRVQRGRDVRDQKYKQRWDEYTRLWRGFWAEADRNVNSERSKIISPALQQAIEMAVAEIEEAFFSRAAWIDIEDDIADQEKDDALAYRDQLLEDFDFAGVEDAIAKAILLSAVYGTGLAKINVVVKKQRSIENGMPLEEEKVVVMVDPVRPDEFVIDPSATTIDDAHYCAHEVVKPLHSVRARQRAGAYRKAELGAWTGTKGDTTGTGQLQNVDPTDEGVLITEYYGKIPGKYLGRKGEDLIEAIAVIGNETVLLKLIPNPFIMGDRPVISFQFDAVPGEFWGRGVAERGYNPQKALDSELRARMDALALVGAPMLGADITRLPRNPDMRVRPGKIFFTRGRPSEIIERVGFDAAGLALTFQQSGDLERMVQMGTGAMDSAAPLSTNRRNETVGGMSMLNAGFLKRSKRTMKNIERQFMSPLIRRCLWRYMQFDPERYPTDLKFTVKTAMGIMAKEVEQATLTQLLGYVPPESPAHPIILKAVFDNTASSEKDELKRAIDAMLAPPDEAAQAEQQMVKQMAMEREQAEIAKIKADALKSEAEAALAQAKMQHTQVLASLEDDRVEIEAANAAVAAQQVRVADKKVKADANRPKPSSPAKK